MKSEKAKQFIKEHEWMDTEVGTTAIYSAYAYNAVELAEQEAEERMRQKAIRAFGEGCFCDDKGALCGTCSIQEDFIRKLNKEDEVQEA